MQIFELHFKAQGKEEIISDAFCYVPENVYEKRLGSLFLIGELKNALPQNAKLLEKIFQAIKEKYYTLIPKSAGQALTEGLKKLNDFLAEEVKKENVSWLGNLNLAVFSLKDFELNFTKTGGLKIFLLRGEQITEISKSLELEEIEPYPLKIFGKIVSGSLSQNDKLLVVSGTIVDFFSTKKILEKISLTPDFDEKTLKEILSPHKEELLEIPGVCLLIALTKQEKPAEVIDFKEQKEKFSFFKILEPFLLFFKNRKTKKTPKRTKPASAQKPAKVHSLVSFFAVFSRLKVKISSDFKNKFILILFLTAVLTTGFFIFGQGKKENLKIARVALEETKIKVAQAEKYLIIGREKEANALLLEAWNMILPQTEPGALLVSEANPLKKSIEEKLLSLNKIEEISNPELIFDFSEAQTDLIPQKMLLLAKEIYFHNPLSLDLFKLKIAEKTGEILKKETGFKLGTSAENQAFFFANPDLLFFLKNGRFSQSRLTAPSAAFNFDKISSFKSSVYFLDSQSGEIIKYSVFLQDSEIKTVSEPEFWLLPQTKKPVFAKSIAIDGSFWVLTKENTIDRYYKGLLQETLNLNVFPLLENPRKIWTDDFSSDLYLLEPAQKRIIILTKQGKIVKQYRSEKFDNLLDFAVSKDDKTIYLLNGLEIYQINP